MKRFYWGGIDMSFWSRIVRLFYIRFFWVVMLLGVFFCLFSLSKALAQSTQVDRAVAGVEEIKPLAVGDKIPEEIWQLPLSVVKQGSDTKELRLADYRGKVILIDFWATWCKSCIQTMPKMHDLARFFPDKVVLLAVTYESEKVVRNFLEKNQSEQLQQVKDHFVTLVDDKVMKDLIPHQSLPHIAIINASGILEQVTKPPLLNKEILGSLVRKEAYHLPVYRESVDTSLMGLNFPDVKPNKPIYYGALMGHLDGFSTQYKEWNDTLCASQRGHYINYSILRLFNRALKTRFNATLASRQIILVDNPAQIDWLVSGYQQKTDDYSYTYTLPLDFSHEQISTKMLADLREYSGYNLFVIKRKMPCLILRRTEVLPKRSGFPKTQANFVLNIPTTDTRVAKKAKTLNYMRARELSNLVYQLNSRTDVHLPYMLDESGIDFPIDLDLPFQVNSLEAWVDALAKQGLLLEFSERDMEMLVISDKNSTVDLATLMQEPLLLTDKGYLLQQGVGYE